MRPPPSSSRTTGTHSTACACGLAERVQDEWNTRWGPCADVGGFAGTAEHKMTHGMEAAATGAGMGAGVGAAEHHHHHAHHAGGGNVHGEALVV